MIPLLNRSPQLRLKLSYVGQAAFNGILFGLLYTLGQSIMTGFPLGQAAINGGVIGCLVGGILGFFEMFIFPKKFRKKPFVFLLLTRTLVYSFVISGSLLLVLGNVYAHNEQRPLMEGLRLYLANGEFAVDFIFSLIASLLIISAMQISTLHGKGELRKFIMGKYHQPKEVERIFMFVDMKSSTTLAEQLGNLRYSRFIKDFFFDLTDAILLTKGEVYQYVGDEIILTWPMETGLHHARCIQCFYAMKKSLEARKEAYLKQYGCFPEFKAGLHGGKVVVTWVGEIRKEIVYHGDVLNTTARIQAMCNPLSQEFLISGELLERLHQPAFVEATYVNRLLLRGKHQEVSLFGLKERSEEPEAKTEKVFNG